MDKNNSSYDMVHDENLLLDFFAEICIVDNNSLPQYLSNHIIHELLSILFSQDNDMNGIQKYVNGARFIWYQNSCFHYLLILNQEPFFLHPQTETISFNIMIEEKLNVIQFNNGIETWMRPKINGNSYGFIINKRNIDNSKSSYYIKGFGSYPITLHSKCMTTSSQSMLKLEMNQYLVSELMIYAVLEKLNLGPKVYFHINPYIKYAVFITTESLNTDTHHFWTLDKVIIELTALNIPITTYESFPTLILQLMKIIMTFEILCISDWNRGNIGIAFPKTEDIIMAIHNPNLYIIDFSAGAIETINIAERIKNLISAELSFGIMNCDIFQIILPPSMTIQQLMKTVFELFKSTICQSQNFDEIKSVLKRVLLETLTRSKNFYYDNFRNIGLDTINLKDIDINLNNFRKSIMNRFKKYQDYFHLQ